MANSRETSRYRQELYRVASYISWPGMTEVCPLTLARAGFYYDGSNSVVLCWCCGKEIDANVYGNNVKRRHRIVAPNCPCLTNAESDVPLPLPTDLNIQVRNTTETDHGKPCTDLVSLREIIGRRASRRGIFEPKNILKLNRSEPDFDVFRREIVRLASFKDWPETNCAAPGALAHAGFFYAGKRDIVRCAFCRKFCDQWKREDVPLAAHQRICPDCPFVRNESAICANVRIEDDSLDEEVQLIGITDIPYQSDGQAAEEPAVDGSLDMLTFHSGTLSECAQRPKHPDMTDVEVRKLSFYKSRAVIPKGQNPIVLAEAGFYYYGPSDYCKCFFCDGGLKNWQEDDEPWSEHARWYPRCGYIKSRKGPGFIITKQNDRSARLPEVQPRFAGATGLALGSSLDASEMLVDSDTMKTVTAMGYSRDLVLHVARRRRETKGDAFPNVESLVDALLLEQEKGRGSELTASASFENDNTVPKQGANIHVLNSDSSARDTLRAESASVQPQKLTSKGKGKNKKKKKKSVQQSKTGNQSGSERQTMKPSEETENVEADEDPETNPDDSSLMLDEDAIERSLLAENQLLKDARTCKVCMENEVNIVFLPCGHLVCCQDCAPELRICAICRALIRGTVKTFLA